MVSPIALGGTIAPQYDKEAAELQGKAVTHEQMLRAYESVPTYQKVRRKRSTAAMEKHCRNLVGHYTKAPEEAEAMGRKHRELAAKESQ